MPPRSEPHKVPEFISTRSVYGDNHAATGDAMMAEHAKMLRAAGLIGEEMEAQLSQPWHRTGEMKMNYTEEYLEMHPEHTGSNAAEMPTYETAMKKQKERDRAQEKWLADWRAGKIDDNGNRIGGERRSTGIRMTSEPNSGTYSIGSHQDRSTLQKAEHLGDSPTKTGSSSFAAGHTSMLPKAAQQPGAAWTEASTDDDLPLPTHRKLTVAQVPSSSIPSHSSPSDVPSSPPAPTPQAQPHNLKLNTATKPEPIIKTSKSTAPTNKPAFKSRVRHRGKQPTPIQPLPNQPDYIEFNYFALAALCRDRALPGKGSAAILRNRLVQDDINVAQGLEREKRSHNSMRREYKHEAPEIGPARGSPGVSASASVRRGRKDETMDEKRVRGAGSPNVVGQSDRNMLFEKVERSGEGIRRKVSSGIEEAYGKIERAGEKKRKRSAETDGDGADGQDGEVKKIRTTA